MIRRIRYIGTFMVAVICLCTLSVSISSYQVSAAEIQEAGKPDVQIDDAKFLNEKYIKVVNNQFELDQTAYDDARFTPLFLQDSQKTIADQNKTISENGLTIDPITKCAVQIGNNSAPLNNNYHYGTNKMEWHGNFVRFYMNKDVASAACTSISAGVGAIVGAFGVAAGIFAAVICGFVGDYFGNTIPGGIIVDVYTTAPIRVIFMGFQ